MTRFTATPALLACVAVATASAQVTQPAIPSFRSEVQAVTIDVSVLDEQGRPVPGLTSGDFVVAVAGQVRRVVSVTYVDAEARRTGGVAAASGSIVLPVSTNDHVGVGRLVLFVVDQNTLDHAQARLVTNAAARFFSQLTPADRSAVVMLPVGAGLAFTSDHTRVLQALQRAAGFSSMMTEARSLGLEETRAIASGDFGALQNAARRECPGQETGLLAGGTPGGGGGGGAAGGGQQGGGTGGGNTTGGSPLGQDTAPLSLGASDGCTRRLQFEAQTTWHQLHSTALASMTSMRAVLSELKKVPGEKTVVLISGGWPLDPREATSEVTPLSDLASQASATVHTLFTWGSEHSAAHRSMSNTPLADHSVRRWPLETLSGMTGGSSYRVDTGGEHAFERLGRELSAYYRIGVEQDPRDATVASRMLKVQVLRKGVSVRAPERIAGTSYADRDVPARLENALVAPLPSTGLGVRMTSYVALEPGASGASKVVVVGEAFGLQAGEATLQLAVRDTQGKLVVSSPLELGSPNDERVPFTTSVTLAPGRYAMRVAVMDGAGSVGSVDHGIEVARSTVGSLTVGELGLGLVPEDPSVQPGYLVDAINQGDRLALQLDLEGETDAVTASDVLFELATAEDGPALATIEATRGASDGTGTAQAVADLSLLPAGVYIARARVTDGAATGTITRPFIVVGARAGAADGVLGGSSTGASRSRLALNPPPFALEQVLAPQVLGVFLDRLASRPDATASSVAPVIQALRTTPARDVKVPGGLANDSPVAAGFVEGLAKLSRTELDPAAQSFRASLRASSDFYPAMIYLGACFAAAGKDREAAGAWQTALIKEADVPVLHQLLVDALLRLKRNDAALAALDRARARWPDDPAFTRRRVHALAAAGRTAEALDALDRLQAPGPGDERVLFVGLQVLYESLAAGAAIQDPEVDRARLSRYAEAYRRLNGPSMALVETWVAALNRP
jgi:VWFA-related protein